MLERIESVYPLGIITSAKYEMKIVFQIHQIL